MKKVMPKLFIATMMTLIFVNPAFAGEKPFLAEITIFAGDSAPKGYAFCEGQYLAINNHAALYSLLGTKYGGDGRTTFALPDLRRAEQPLGGARYIIALDGLWPTSK